MIATIRRLSIATIAFSLLILAQGATANQLPDFTELVKKVGPTVVNIATEQSSRRHKIERQLDIPGLPPELQELLKRYLEQQQGGHGRKADPGLPDFDSASLGAGFIISKDGYILTNHHVVSNADRIIVRLYDRRELDAEVIGSDKRSDVALIKVEADDLPVAKIGSSADLKVGEWVMAIGTPFGFERSATVGIVSAMGRSLPNGNYVPFIQTDVAINPGNSGGPLFNLDGEVIGVNSQIYSRTGGYMGLSFSIPIDVAMNAINQLRDHGHVTRGYLGVLIQDVDRDLAESFGMNKPEGALVSRVLADGPADKAGIRVGDVIIAFNDQAVPGSSALPPMVGRTEVGSSGSLGVMRDGKRLDLAVKLGELPEEPGFTSASATGKSRDNRLGLAVSPLSDKQREATEVAEGGVLVTRVTAGGAAAKTGIKEGDVLLRIGHAPIRDTHDFTRLVRELPAGKSVPVLVQRGGGPTFLPLRVPK